MQETEFITQNKQKWSDFESEMILKDKDPEKLLDLFIQSTDDLSYARTHYTNRSVRFYLNGLARQVHNQLYQNRKSKKNAFALFWGHDLPQALHLARPQLAWSFGIMVLGLAIGIVSSMYYQEFPAIILSEGYVEKTEQLIAEGNPMGIYGLDKDPFHMFLSIAWNNIQYAFGAFAFGVLFGIGTIYSLLSTGIMVGAFAQFFVAKGLFKQFFLAVMLHGTLELGMITIAGAAGLMMAKSVLFPGTFTRIESLVVAARSSIKIMIAVSVFLLYAALIEGFLTRHTDASDIARLALIVLSAVILLGYFVWYPWRLARRGLLNKETIEDLPELEKPIVLLDVVKSAGQMITETFYMFFKSASSLLHQTWIWSLLATGLAFIILNGQMGDLNNGYVDEIYQLIWPWAFYRPFYDVHSSIWLVLTLVLILTGALYSMGRLVPSIFSKMKSHRGRTLLTSFSIALMWMTLLQLNSAIRAPVMFVFVPYGLLVLMISVQESISIFTALIRGVRLLITQFGAFFLMSLAFFAMHWLVLMFIQSVMFQYVREFIVINIPITMNSAEQVPFLFQFFVLGGALIFSLMLMCVGAFLFYYSTFEVSTAQNLMQRIKQVGNRVRLYGMEREDD